MLDFSTLQRIYEGSTKTIYKVPEMSGHLAVAFKSTASIFDVGPFKTLFPDSDRYRCSVAVSSFLYLQEKGISTHFVRRLSDTMILVTGATVPERNQTICIGGRRLLPLEVLWRREVTPKTMERIEAGTLSPSRFSLAVGELLKVGARFDPIYVECSTKWELSDRYLNDVEAAYLAGLTQEDLQRLFAFTRIISDHLVRLFGAFHVQTGKFEIAIDPFGKFMLCDAITSDELELGGFDKNPLRDWYRLHHPDWVVALEVAKKQFPGDKSRWPSYPCEPPAALVEKMIGVYAHVAQTLG